MENLPGYPSTKTVFLTLKEVIIQTPILHYPDPSKCYIVYTNVSDDACGAQLSQQHNGQELPIAFILGHLYANSTKMEHPKTGSQWGLLCHNQVELLPAQFRYHHVK